MAKGKRGGKGGDATLTAHVDHKAFDKFADTLPRTTDGEVGDALRRLGEEFVSDTRRKIKAGPGTGKYGTRSREKAAAGIGFDIKSGRLVLESTGGNQPTEHRGFAAFYGQRSWSHPVYGGRARVTQRGQPFWAPETYARRAEQLLADAGQRALDKADK